MDFAQFFKEIRERFIKSDVSQVDGNYAIQINLTGSEEESGTYYIEVKDHVLSIEPYEYYDRNVMLTISAANFTKLLNKTLDPVVAFTLGKLKVEGDLTIAMELQNFL